MKNQPMTTPILPPKILLIESDPVAAAEAIERSCSSCNRQFCRQSAGDMQPLSEGYVGPDDGDLVYGGSHEKCYNVKFVKFVGRSWMNIHIYIDGTFQARLNLNESTDVCGKDIMVYGQWVETYNKNDRAYWHSTELKNASN